MSRSLAELEARLGIEFRQTELLRLALIHESSMDRESSGPIPESNERLEFLGDAVLGAAAAAFLYRTYPDAPEGTLTMLRASLVRRSIATVYADDINLGDYLLVNKVDDIGDGRGLASVKSSAFEAVVGALFIDRGFDLTAAFLDTFFQRHLPQILAADLHRNPKSELQEFTQAAFRVTPKYSMIARTGPDHDSRFVAEVTVEGIGSHRGEGVNRQQAEQEAARQLLARLKAVT